MTEYQTFIGVDIGKFDCVAVPSDKGSKPLSFTNNLSGWRTFCRHYKEFLKGSLVIAETTGGYEKHFLHHLHKQGIHLHRANTIQVKNFIRSLGTLAKTDALDAQGLARYGKERHQDLTLYVPLDPQEDDLQTLCQRASDLSRMLVQEKNRLQAPGSKSIQSSCKKMIAILTKEEASIRGKMKKLIESLPSKKAAQKVLMTIPGIGEKVSQDLVCLMPELGCMSRRQAASLAGLAPHANESGTFIGRRRIRGGRVDVRRVLFMAAMTSTRSKAGLGDFYQKLVGRGKVKMIALTAVMRKIIVIANAKLRDSLAES